MHLRHIVSVAVLLCALLSRGPDALAGARPVELKSLVGVPQRKVFLPGTSASQYVCRLGQSGDPVAVLADPTSDGAIFFGVDDTYWTYLELRPDSCPGCGSGYAGTLSTAHLALFFPIAPETVTVNVSVVHSVPIPCHYPNYLDPYAAICSAFPVTLDCQAQITVVDFAIPVPPGCAIDVPAAPPGQVPFGAAFLGFDFLAASDTSMQNKPGIVVQAAAKACTSFNPIGFLPIDFVLEYGVGNPVMYADVSSCDGPTPARRSSWGRLKLLYR